MAARKPRKDRNRDEFSRDIIGPDGKPVTVALPSLAYLRPGLRRRARHMSANSALWYVIEESVPSEVLDAIDDMDPIEFDEMIEAWTDHSGITPGDS